MVLWHGMKVSTLIQLLRQGVPLHWSRWPRIALLPSMTLYNSAMAAVENLLYKKRIEQVQIEHPPVFILGYWRSGTTLLHNLLTADPQFTYPSMYQTLFPWHFLTTQKVTAALTGWMVPKSRPMDNVPVSWDVPQEDDVALCIMTLISPYMLVAFPHDLEKWKESFTIENLPEAQQRAWKEALMLLMKKITLRHPKPIVLKSPSHTYRIRVLLEMFPEARFVYIYRNPYDVFNSSIHLRHTMIEENTFGRAVHPNIENDVIESYLEAIHRYEREKSLIPDGHLHEVRYESLAEDPLGEMQRLYEGLHIDGFDRLQEILQPQVEELKRYKKNKFDPDPHWMKEVYDRCRDVFELYDYPDPRKEAGIATA
jgi:omega-hydroxy-beta-dihydromenaquinone-9 sulfotransferase